MGFRVEYEVIEADEVGGRKRQIQIFQSLRHPEALQAQSAVARVIVMWKLTSIESSC